MRNYMIDIIVFGSASQVEGLRRHLNSNVKIQSSFDLTTQKIDVGDIGIDVMPVCCDKVQEDILALIGIKIRPIRWYKYCDTLLKNPLDGIVESKCDGLIFGMSHSQSTIKEEKLTAHKYFKLSSPSMDMFCHLGFLNKCSELVPQPERIRSIILEMPYYIFNYDLSKFGDFVYTKLNYFEILGNYHSFHDVRAIEEFKAFKSLIDQSTFNNGTRDKKEVSNLRQLYRNIKIGIRAALNNDSVWKNEYTSTIKENKLLYLEFLRKAKVLFPNAQLTILVMPFNPVFRITHKKEIQNQKQIFNSVVHDPQVDVVDDFLAFGANYYWSDHCHIKHAYDQKYTMHLEQILKGHLNE